jgi:hypothetical protein
MYAIILELLRTVASPEGVALGSLIAASAMITRIVTTRDKTKPAVLHEEAGILHEETAKLVALREQDRLDSITACEQARLDRVLNAQLDTIQEAIERLTEPESPFAFAPRVSARSDSTQEQGDRQAA